MTRLALLWAAIKASLCAILVTATVALLIAGSAELNNWLARQWLEPHQCLGLSGAACGPSRFWVSYWWLTLTLVIGPVWFASLVVFVRKFATPGNRLIATGFLGIYHGSGILMDGLDFLGVPVQIQGIDRNLGIAYAAFGAALLLGGLYFGLLRKPVAPPPETGDPSLCS